MSVVGVKLMPCIHSRNFYDTAEQKGEDRNRKKYYSSTVQRLVATGTTRTSFCAKIASWTTVLIHKI
jgi:hypothetical protein